MAAIYQSGSGVRWSSTTSRLPTEPRSMGAGIAYLPEEHVADALAQDQLIRVLADWCPPFPGHHLYYPSCRQLSPAMTVLIEALRGSRPTTPSLQQPTT